jgi:hypothetical protein
MVRMTPDAGQPPFDLDSLREAFRAAVEASGYEVPRPDCVDDDRIWAAAIGNLDAGSVRAIVDHVAVCPRCAESWRLAASMAGRVRSDRSRIVRWPAAGTWVSLGLAATFVVAAGYAVWPRAPESPNAPLRSPEGPVLESRVTDPELPRDQFVLRWTPGPAGTTYSVSVSDEQGRMLDEARDLQRPEYVVPPSALSPLAATSRVFWRVDASLPDGTKVTSRDFTVILR